MPPPCDAECMMANRCGGKVECCVCGKLVCEENAVCAADHDFCSTACRDEWLDNQE